MRAGGGRCCSVVLFDSRRHLIEASGLLVRYIGTKHLDALHREVLVKGRDIIIREVAEGTILLSIGGLQASMVK